LPHTVLQAAAEALQLAPQQQQHLQSRVRLQPGRLSQVLAAHPHQLELPAPQPPEPLAYFVQVPAGPYPIGDELQPAERPAQLWHSPGYAIARFPVTNADFEQFMQAGGYQQPDYWLPEGWTFVQQEGMQTPAFWCKRGYQSGPDYPDYPVVGVSWYEALAYTTWRQCRLPTELEWEAAGRGPEGLRWPWGNSWDAERANTADNQLMNTTPVGLYPAGASPLGCMDLIGNVFEWTLSVYQAYPYQAEDGREDLRSPAPRTLRGCSWNHRGSYFTRLSYRFQAEPETRHSDIGFRCAQAGPLI
jgi:formylglycine-generating enzyme required for sulfatase activity